MSDDETVNKLDEYLALVAKRKAAKETLELKMPSSAIWLYKSFDLKSYIVSGKLPAHLIGRLKSVQKLPQPEMSEDEMVKLGMSALEIVRSVMLNNLIFPRISLEEKEGYILPEQIDPEDFEFFFQFVMNGGSVQKKT